MRAGFIRVLYSESSGYNSPKWPRRRDGKFTPDSRRQNSNVRVLPFYVRSTPETRLNISVLRQEIFDPKQSFWKARKGVCTRLFSL